ncbi:RluA family pseudouridine synthase [Cytobacillus kochii]|uniref:RluA family pseudouridine synthase n=1 Tax=Cytobacillus kochii TaxID=859143 RepID=UPI0025A0ACE0|nr:RluA family pseudouridine synthase [Cytobacillus kochii]MDM5206814.1 RluA family pseudouridine synthase [Cytobacillus kochii]
MVTVSKKGEWFELTIPKKWAGQSATQLFREIWGAPKKLTHQMRMEGCVKKNNNPIVWEKPLIQGDRLQFKLLTDPQVETLENDGFYTDVDVRYEDDHLIIFNKPAGMETHPHTLVQKNTLLDAAKYYMQLQGESTYIRHIHRLDKETSGVILFAKHSLAGAILDTELAQRFIKRTYMALVHGQLKNKHDSIELPIGKDRHHSNKRRVSTTGQYAKTTYDVQAYDSKNNISLITCQLDTGRTHQIRVHLSHIGHPLVGDHLYGGKNLLTRQALHAYKLEWQHPFTKEKQEITCPAPADFRSLCP